MDASNASNQHFKAEDLELFEDHKLISELEPIILNQHPLDVIHEIDEFKVNTSLPIDKNLDLYENSILSFYYPGAPELSTKTRRELIESRGMESLADIENNEPIMTAYYIAIFGGIISAIAGVFKFFLPFLAWALGAFVAVIFFIIYKNYKRHVLFNNKLKLTMEELEDIYSTEFWIRLKNYIYDATAWYIEEKKNLNALQESFDRYKKVLEVAAGSSYYSSNDKKRAYEKKGIYEKKIRKSSENANKFLDAIKYLLGKSAEYLSEIDLIEYAKKQQNFKRIAEIEVRIKAIKEDADNAHSLANQTRLFDLQEGE